MESANWVITTHIENNPVWTLASDVDGTLTGDPPALVRLAQRLGELRSAGKLFLVISTGRRLDQVLSGIAVEGLPEPDAAVCQVGTEIYLSPLSADTQPLPAWREALLRYFSHQEATSFLADIDGLQMQPAEFNTELKTSCFLDQCPDPEIAAAEIQRRVAPHGDRYQVIWSSGRDLDILPAASGKGKAIRFLVEQLDRRADHVIVAGDTGNDATMFEEFRAGIVVGNAQPELVAMAKSLKEDRVYQAQRPHAAGVEEGLEYFGVLDSSAL